jgi:DNA-binding MarR family transcriptional regulator
MSAGGTTAVIGRLVGAGLLQRDAGPANHRNVRLTATDRASAVLPLAPASAASTACDLANLRPSQRATIADFVLRLTELVERDTEAMHADAVKAHADEVPSPPQWS